METELCEFSVIYDGPGIYNMDVRKLGPALLSFGDLIKECDEILNNDKSQLKVVVNSSFSRGSFKIDFEISKIHIQGLLEDFYKKLPELLENIGILDVTGTIGVGVSITSLFKLKKWLKERNIKNIKSISDTEDEITIEDDEKRIVPKYVTNIYNINNGKATQNIVYEPLNGAIIESGV